MLLRSVIPLGRSSLFGILLLVSCTGGGGSAPGTGGAARGGGSATGTGGASSTGGATNSGGAPSSGGGTATGGNTSTGGASPGGSGGGSATGGATSTGGAGSGGRGGMNASGGATATGGAASGGHGGTNASGGAIATGGAGSGGRGGTSASGGVTATGGAPGGSSGSTIPAGFTTTPGGRGGTIIKVTTLAASGVGSLAAALAATGPRIIVFEVGGIIDLNLARLNITQPFVTIAGQTAPTPGITLIRGGMAITTHDVIIQHIRFRIGDAGQAAGSGFEPDVSTDGPNATNIIVDHCSVAWGVDENLSISGPRFDGTAGTSRQVTYSNNIIAEGLNNSIHSKGSHSMGTLIHDYCTDVAIIGNLYAHNNERNPWFKGFATGVVVNNVIYNPGIWAVRVGAVVNEWADSGITPQGPKISVVGNVMKHGADTPTSRTMIGSNSSGSAYATDNLATNVSGGAIAILDSVVTTLSTRPSWPTGLTARPASETMAYVLAHAGARPKERDSVDMRIVASVQAGTGRFVNSQTGVGGYPTATATQRTLTVPATDIDGWLAGYTAAVE